MTPEELAAIRQRSEERKIRADSFGVASELCGDVNKIDIPLPEVLG